MTVTKSRAAGLQGWALSACRWQGALIALCLGIMVMLGGRSAGAKASGVQSSPQGDHIAITVLDFESGRRHQRLELEVVYRLANAPDRLLNFAEHFREPQIDASAPLDELKATNYLHHAYVPASLVVEEALWQGVPIDLIPTVEGGYLYPKGQGDLRIRMTLKVPRGTWPLGCVRGRCAAVGVLGLVPVRWDRQSKQGWPMPAPYEIHWEAPRKPKDLVVHESGRSGQALLAPALFWGAGNGSFWASRRFFYRGLKVQIEGAFSPLHRSSHNVSPWPWPRDQAGRLRRLAQEAIDTALAMGLKLPLGEGLLLQMGPLRSSMAQSYSGMVIVSDRYLDTLPVDRFSKMHDTQVVRAILDALSTMSMMDQLRPADLVWAPRSVAASLIDAWRAQRKLRDEDMAQILKPVGFIPGVDTILYSGQTTQSDVFFRSADDAMPLRRHPFYFSNQSPTGLRLYHKLRDRLGPEGFEAWRKALIKGTARDPRLLARSLGPSWTGAAWSAFFAQWLGPYPSVDYAVGRTRSIAETGGYRHEIELVREAEGEVYESVPFRVTDAKGNVVNRKWRPQGPGSLRETLVVRTPGKLVRVEVDPELRLQEDSRIPTRSWEREAHGDPRFNNSDRGDLRFVYTGLYFNVAFAELFRAKTSQARWRSFSGLLAWELGLKRDLRRMFYFVLSKGRTTWVSGDAGISMQFGRKITGNRRLYTVNVGTGADWLTRAGLDKMGGLGISQKISVTRDTRRFRRSPQGGTRVRAGLSRNDDWLAPQGGGQRLHRSDWTAALSAAQYFRLAHHHVLAAQARVYASFGLNRPMFRGLVRAGGIGGLSAFATDELYGRGVGMLKAEYRHIFADTLRLNALGLAWIRDLGGAAFVGGAFVSDCDRIGGFNKRANYVGQVGYGVTMRYDLLGIAPMMVRLDLAMPLGRRARQCLGRAFPDALAERQGLPGHRASELLAPFAFNFNVSHDF